jgi:16S rRNA (cytidine(1402)-2'-O)-methyltransferase
MGKLYVVPTPVGNLEDITLRALKLLKECDLILAEDTRTSGFLLKHFGIETHMQSHHKFNEHQSAMHMAERMKGGETMALISHSGNLRPRFPAGERVHTGGSSGGMPSGSNRFCPGTGGIRVAQ